MRNVPEMYSVRYSVQEWDRIVDALVHYVQCKSQELIDDMGGTDREWQDLQYYADIVRDINLMVPLTKERKDMQRPA